MPQRGLGFPRIVVGIVVEKHDLPAHFLLKTACRQNLGHKKPLGKEAGWLLAKTNDRCRHKDSTTKTRRHQGPRRCGDYRGAFGEGESGAASFCLRFCLEPK